MQQTKVMLNTCVWFMAKIKTKYVYEYLSAKLMQISKYTTMVNTSIIKN